MAGLLRADALLLLANKGGIQVPSKLYEYLGLRKPILALWQAADDEAANIVRSCAAGWTVHDDEGSIYTFLQDLLEASLTRPTYDGSPIEEYGADVQLGRYLALVRKLAEPSATPAAVLGI